MNIFKIENLKGLNTKIFNKEFIRSGFVYFVLIALIVGFSLINDRFFSMDNFAVIGRQTAITAVIALGMTFVITTAEIDLSVGSIVGCVVMISTLTLQAGMNPLIASLAGIAVGVFFGFANGILITKLNIPSFLVTLGTLGIARGVAMTVTGNRTIVVYDKSFTNFWGSGEVFGIPNSILWMGLFLIITFIIYNYTRFGNYVKAVGGNSVAARFSGINTDKIIITAMMISGFLAAIGGLMMVARINAGRPEVGASLNLDAITAVILGGTSLFGGKGSIIKTIVGAFIITIITNALIILGFQINVQMIVKGIIIIAAVSISEKK